MAAVGFLSDGFAINLRKIHKREVVFLEAEIFRRICEYLKASFREKYKIYFKLLNFTVEMENNMLEASFIKFLIKDILLTDEYSIEGIAYYTQTPLDVICDLLSGQNTAPSLRLSEKIIDLHRSVRKKFYQEMMKKIIDDFAIAQ